MAGNKHDLDPHDLDQQPVGYERSDVNAWAIGKFGIALALICVASIGLIFMLFHYFITSEGPEPQRATSNLSQTTIRKPGGTVLEETPVQDLARERAEEDRLLNSYGWVDKQKGVVRIPISNAIDMLAQKGLPVRTTVPVTSDVSIPTESGLGVAK